MKFHRKKEPRGEAERTRRLILAGAGHSHLQILRNLDEYARRDCEVILVAPDDFVYSGMGPGILSETYGPEANRIPTSAIVQSHGGGFIRDKVNRIDGGARAIELAGGQRLSYDLLSLNIGSEINTADIRGSDADRWPVKPISNLTRLREFLKKKAGLEERLEIVVAGGGAAGCEIALNVGRLLKAHGAVPSIRIVTPGGILLKHHGQRATAGISKEMRRLGIQVLDNRVVMASRDSVGLQDGALLDCHVLIQATGICPPAVLKRSGLPTADDGSLLVNDHLQSVAYPDIFGAGDCVGFRDQIPQRVGVHAVRESVYLHDNLLAWLDQREMRSYTARDRFLLILNLGDRRGLLLWRGFAFRGYWAFWMKNFLDQRFMNSMQP